MKLRKIIFISLSLSFLFVFNLYARSTTSRQANTTKVVSSAKSSDEISVRSITTYNISVPGKTQWIRLTVLVPESLKNRQKIKRVEYSIKPVRYFINDGKRYAEILIREPERTEKLEVTVHADIYRYDLQTARQDRDMNEFQQTDLDEFLKEEEYIEKNDRQIKEIAKTISGSTDEQIVREIYNYVIDNMEYLVQGKKDRGAVRALQYKKGDCSEYSDLFVAICRAKKIPARVITGISIQSDTKTAKHNWVEVYLKNYGWVPFDPSKGDIRNNSLRNRLFERLKPTYIYYTYIRNDEVLQNYHYCAFKYFGDPIRVTDSIKFEFPNSSNR